MNIGRQLRGVHISDTCVYIHTCVYVCVYIHTHGHIREMKVVPRVCIDRWLTPTAPAQACPLRWSAASSLDGLLRAAARPGRSAPPRCEQGAKTRKKVHSHCLPVICAEERLCLPRAMLVLGCAGSTRAALLPVCPVREAVAVHLFRVSRRGADHPRKTRRTIQGSKPSKSCNNSEKNKRASAGRASATPALAAWAGAAAVDTCICIVRFRAEGRGKQKPPPILLCHEVCM